MKRKHYMLMYLTWLLPAYLLGLTLHQGIVYKSVIQTYNNGESYNADVVDFDIKKIAAQTNGYVVLEFTPADGTPIRRKLSLSIDMASSLTEFKIIPVRYQPGNFTDIVMIPTYAKHKSVILSNLAMAFIGFLITVPIGWAAHRYARRKARGDDPDTFIIERIDPEPTE